MKDFLPRVNLEKSTAIDLAHPAMKSEHRTIIKKWRVEKVSIVVQQVVLGESWKAIFIREFENLAGLITYLARSVRVSSLIVVLMEVNGETQGSVQGIIEKKALWT